MHTGYEYTVLLCSGGTPYSVSNIPATYWYSRFPVGLPYMPLPYEYGTTAYSLRLLLPGVSSFYSTSTVALLVLFCDSSWSLQNREGFDYGTVGIIRDNKFSRE